MSKCIRCRKNEGDYPHYDGGYVCDKCVGYYFTCPDCGTIFDREDREHGDAGNGFCVKCAPDH